MDDTNLLYELQQFTGTENYYRQPLFNFIYTDGVKFLAEKARCYWLIEAIGSYQYKKIKDMPFQVWKLKVNEDKSCSLTMVEDTGKPIEVKQDIEYTDFPLNEIELWLIDDGTNKTLILPSEY